MRVLAIVPAFNEEECILNTVSGLMSCCPDVDVLVINDGSTDATAALCRKANINCVSLPVNSGLSCGFQTGMKYALRSGYDAAVQFDADGQHLPEFIPVMEEALKQQEADIVIASRFLEGERPLTARTMGNALISWLIRITTGTRITDPTSGMRMYNRRMIRFYANAFDLAPEPDAIALICRKGNKVIEVPATMQDRQGGVSYLNLPNIIRYMMRTCLSILMYQWFR